MSGDQESSHRERAAYLFCRAEEQSEEVRAAAVNRFARRSYGCSTLPSRAIVAKRFSGARVAAGNELEFRQILRRAPVAQSSSPAQRGSYKWLELTRVLAGNVTTSTARTE